MGRALEREQGKRHVQLDPALVVSLQKFDPAHDGAGQLLERGLLRRIQAEARDDAALHFDLARHQPGSPLAGVALGSGGEIVLGLAPHGADVKVGDFDEGVQHHALLGGDVVQSAEFGVPLLEELLRGQRGDDEGQRHRAPGDQPVVMPRQALSSSRGFVHGGELAPASSSLIFLIWKRSASPRNCAAKGR